MTGSAIFTYHSLDESGSVISLAPQIFRLHMELLAESAIPVVPLSAVRKTAGSVAITFDDGFANFEADALPVLARHGFPATVFLVSGHCGGKNDWECGRAAVPRLPLLSWQAARGLKSEAVQWGAHTVTHPDLARVAPARAEVEMRDCRATIEDNLGTRVSTFAYPYGSATPATRAMASGEFEMACGTRLRYVEAQSDAWELPRLDAYYFQSAQRFKTALGTIGPAYVALRRALREGRSWLSR